MASFYRRRRYPRRRRRTLRPWFRRYRRYGRRRRVRRRRRRRVYRKRRYITSVMQWMPKHRALCKINGWFPAIMCLPHCESQAAIKYVKERKNESSQLAPKPAYYKRMYGSVFLIHWSLELMYKEWLLWRNYWTVSNDSFDLARYFGTKLTFWPHDDFPYIVWWETDYGYINTEHFTRLHPARAILERNHKIILSRKMGRRKPKRIMIRPPAVHRTSWYFMKDWCNVGLFRLGIAFINLHNPLLHRDKEPISPEVSIGVGYYHAEKNPTTQTHFDTFQDAWGVASGPGKNRLIKYKWWWDDGIGNRYFMIPHKKEGTSWNPDKSAMEGKTVVIKDIEIPYWAAFWGTTPEAIPKDHYVYIWWYCDDGRFNDINEFQDDLDLWNADVLSNKEYITKVAKEHNWAGNYHQGNRPTKIWVQLRPSKESNSYFALQAMLRQSPLVLPDTEIGGSLSLFFQYRSYWQWGGVSPNPQSVLDPCVIPPSGDQPRPVRIRDPRHVHESTLHPWDFKGDGFITPGKFRQLTGEPTSTVAGHPDENFEPPKRSRRDAPLLSDDDSETSEEESSFFSDSEKEQQDPQTWMGKLNYLRKCIKRERNEQQQFNRRIRRLLTE